MVNPVAAGCFTGGLLGLRGEGEKGSESNHATTTFSTFSQRPKGGPTAAVLGCGGFAAFSIVIDLYFNK
jgi:hypothetical protein